MTEVPIMQSKLMDWFLYDSMETIMDLRHERVNVLKKLKMNHFVQLVSFHTPWKHQKTRGFLGGIARDQWDEMG